MIDLFECCGENASVGIIIDFSKDMETYIVGTPADIKAWAYGGCPQKLQRDLCDTAIRLAILLKI